MWKGLTWRRVGGWIRKVPFLSVLAVAVLLQLIGEQFPFSHFPMYAGLSPRSEMIYFTDVRGTKVGTWWWFGEGGAAMNKVLRNVWSKESRKIGRNRRDDPESQRVAAQYVYETYLAKQPEEKRRQIEARGPRMVFVEVWIENGAIATKETVILERQPIPLKR